MTETEIRDLIAYLCQDSVYAYSDEIRQGFLTVEGGHRIGLSGQAVLENENSLRTLKNISFVNIRVAHEIRGVADKILPELYKAIAEKYGADFLEASSVAATAADAIHIDNSSHAAFARAVADKIRKLVEL
mgnify:CR=1 FL=1